MPSLKASEREGINEAERLRLDHLLQETRAALDSATASAAAAAAAEQEAASRAGQERAARQAAEDALYAAESRVESLETEVSELREEARELAGRVEGASGAERVLRGLVDEADRGRVEAEAAGEAVRREVAALRSELLECRRQSDEDSSEKRELARQVRERRARI